ncbi:MAG: hypothetical protein ACRDVM_00640 [Acidimicrobiia bacterium]
MSGRQGALGVLMRAFVAAQRAHLPLDLEGRLTVLPAPTVGPVAFGDFTQTERLLEAGYQGVVGNLAEVS